MMYLSVLFVMMLLWPATLVKGEEVGPYESEHVNIVTVIDTDSLVKDFRSKQPSKNISSPTGLDHKYAFMLAAKKYVVSGQATADLHIKVATGDTIRWFGTTESLNFDRTIILYNIKHSTDIISNPIRLANYEKESIYPEDIELKKLMRIKTKTNTLEASVKSPGTVDYNVHFALYTREREGNHELFGYFHWDPKITI